MENISKSNELEYYPFPIPGATTEKLFAKILNADIKYGPVIAELKMDAGAFIPAHIHYKTEEQHYVLEGDFINDGISYEAGSFFCHDIDKYTGLTPQKMVAVYYLFSPRKWTRATLRLQNN